MLLVRQLISLLIFFWFLLVYSFLLFSPLGMKHISGPYGTLLEFDSLAKNYGLDKGLAEYYQSKRGSFYIVLHPQ
jgi:hypothetical protein